MESKEEKSEDNRLEIGKTLSWKGSSYSSLNTMTSDDRLSTREVGKIKKLITDKKKMEKKNNIVIKGANLERVDRYKKEENKG